MSKIIIYPDDAGGVCVVRPAPNFLAELQSKGITYQEAIEIVAAKDIPTGKPFGIVDSSTLPIDHHRESWEWL